MVACPLTPALDTHPHARQRLQGKAEVVPGEGHGFPRGWLVVLRTRINNGERQQAAGRLVARVCMFCCCTHRSVSPLCH
jgi:hypothetical protein